ncbi:MAG: c-type cytochrome [Cyanobacteriota bacterium SKYGB_h_bin112]|nr:c-type cytochrome [Cyanobacteriota bacterium SKYGB_h_bin112]
MLIGLACWLGVIDSRQLSAWAEDNPNGAAIFEVHCVGCHINGGNIVRRGKTLKLPALKRNGVDSVAAIAELVTNGKANMSAYGNRLTPDEIQAVATYVWQRANQGWR